MVAVTSIYAGILALLYILLAANVIRTRRALHVSLGDGGHELLQRRIRAHGNFAEYAPIALLLIALVEVGSGAVLLVHALGAALVVGRFMHAFAFSTLTRRPIARTGGMAVTLTVIGSAAIACLAAAFFRH